MAGQRHEYHAWSVTTLIVTGLFFFTYPEVSHGAEIFIDSQLLFLSLYLPCVILLVCLFTIFIKTTLLFTAKWPLGDQTGPAASLMGCSY